MFVVDGDYDKAGATADWEAKLQGRILIQDIAFEDYGETTRWVFLRATNMEL